MDPRYVNNNPAIRGGAPQPMSYIQPVSPSNGSAQLNHAPATTGGEMPFMSNGGGTPGRGVSR